MNFELGQRVVITKNLGYKWKEGLALDKTRYFYGYTLQSLPLGSKAIIEKVVRQDAITVVDRDGHRYHFHPEELELCKTKDFSDQQNHTLSELLSESSNADEDLENMVSEKNVPRKFHPKFNTREEFAVWMKEEFPELEIHSKERTRYEALSKRKNEVLAAAQKAYAHARVTTKSCVLDLFEGSYNCMQDTDDCYFAYYAQRFVDLISKVSLNLDSEERHYGTSLKVLK